MVGVPSEADPAGSYIYVITARHCITAAENAAGTLIMRVNTQAGSRIVEGLTDWRYPNDDAIDIAVHEFDLQRADDQVLVPFDNLAIPARMEEHDLGIGDEVGVVGLFHSRSGRLRNLPVVRSGIIASMPEERFEDDAGRFFDAYIVEMRSFGGLSGSPAFYIENRGMIMNRPARRYFPIAHQPVFFGVIRGHWDETTRRLREDADDADVARANLGLALITPIAGAIQVLTSEDLTRARRRQDAEIAQRPQG